MKWVRSLSAIAIALSLSLVGCSKGEHGLNPNKPVSITVWHYYNSAQKNAFDDMIEEFNETVGLEKGIIVEAHNQGSVNELEASITASMNQEVGSQPLPNVFQTYADTAFAAEEKGILADLDDYFTKEEKGAYVTSYMEEGRIGKNGELRIFPVAKSTEVMMLNKVDWERFAQQTGAKLSDLETKEGVVRTAATYYQWTDDQTPEIPDDGKAFYGRDALANLFIIGARQLGYELFEVKEGQVTLHLEKDVLRKIWDVYYVPSIYGHFGAYGRFRSDDAKVGKLIALTGSTSSVAYFPTEVTDETGKIYPIDAIVMPAPVFEGGEQVAVQQGAGMAVVKGEKVQEYASSVFLKWFTQPERNLKFSYDSGYMPVYKEANSFELVTQVADQPLTQVKQDALKVSFDTVTGKTLYTNKAFANGASARKMLESHLQQKLATDLETIAQEVASGALRKEAAEKFDTQENFDEWYASFCQAMEDVIR